MPETSNETILDQFDKSPEWSIKKKIKKVNKPKTRNVAPLEIKWGYFKILLD